MVASSGTLTFLSRIARRTRARRPMSQLSMMTLSSTYAPAWTLTPLPRMEPFTRPPDKIHPPETIESTASPRRFSSSKVNLAGGRVKGSILGRGVKVHAGAYVEDSVIMDNCDIGRRARVRRAILDKNVKVPEDATIGYDAEQDRRLYHVTESGLVVVEGNRSAVDITTVFV